jgi:predicted  nucleic acid-binding Zn-ribbon protein
MPLRGPLWDWVGLDTIAAQLTRMERKLDQLLTGQARGKELIMAEQEEIANLVQQVTANRDAVAAATQAMNGLVQSQADLSQQLAEAIAAAGSDVSPEIRAAADELQANTDALSAAVPQLAKAIVAGTKAA